MSLEIEDNVGRDTGGERRKEGGEKIVGKLTEKERELRRILTRAGYGGPGDIDEAMAAWERDENGEPVLDGIPDAYVDEIE